MARQLLSKIWQSTDIVVLDNALKSPLRISTGGFMVCLRGYCDIVIDGVEYRVSEQNIAVVFPYSMIQHRHYSSDFQCEMVEVGVDFFVQIKVPNKGKYFTEIKAKPVIELETEEIESLQDLLKLLTKRQNSQHHRFIEEVEKGLLKILGYEIAGIYGKRSSTIETEKTRDDIIFTNFIVEIFDSFKNHRDLNYYAQKQQITPAHLSKTVKRVSGQTASQWLTECTINNIKLSLQNKENSIAEIAEEYNFPNASFFSQYFKKYSGQTPKGYILEFKSY